MSNAPLVCDDTGSCNAGNPWIDRRLFCRAGAGHDCQFDRYDDGWRYAVLSRQKLAELRQGLSLGDHVFRHEFAERDDAAFSVATYCKSRGLVPTR